MIVCGNALAGVVETAFAMAEEFSKELEAEGKKISDLKALFALGLTDQSAVNIELTESLPETLQKRLEVSLLKKMRDNFAAGPEKFAQEILDFFADRLKVQQREAGVRHDLIDAVFALGQEDDLVRLLARVRALQGFVETEEGTNLLGGYKRAANILKKEEGSWTPDQVRGDGVEAADAALTKALDNAELKASAAIEKEDFAAAMTALASLRAPIDAFFDQVKVNADDPGTRARRLSLLARFRDAVNRVADFSKIEG